MSAETELARRLERDLDHLPAVPATTYLGLARSARRRRRAVVGLIAASVVALAGGTAMGVLAPGRPDRTSLQAADAEQLIEPRAVSSDSLLPDPDYVAPEPANRVEAVDGLTGVDSFSTAGIPSWAQEYGDHGPVAMAPDGRLWVAPEAVVRRTVIDPLGRTDAEGKPVAASYAVEAEYPGAPDEFGNDIVWVILSAGDGPQEMDEPGRWTDDFELWVDNVTARFQGRPTVAERFVHFADDRSQRLVAGEGVEMVRQIGGVDLGASWAKHPQSSVAEVRWAGRTWFVLAQGPRHSADFYDAYDSAVSAPDLEGFLAFLRAPQ